MSALLEQHLPVVRQYGVNTNKPVNFGGILTVASATATTAGGALAINIGSAAAAPDIYFGSGLPTVSAGQGSLYLRSDGSSTSTRLYVNTDGGTTWTNVTTAG